MPALDSITQEVYNLLSVREERIVFAESCTCGLLAAKLGAIPGASKNLCGSSVTYRADVKRGWLGVKRKSITKFTTESTQIALQMARGVLAKTREAHWGVSVVGHFGPDSPDDKDGIIYICIVRRTKKGKLKIKQIVEHKLTKKSRVDRQSEAAEVVFTYFLRSVSSKSQKEERILKASNAG